jgi:hypothetical protein
MPVRRTTSLTLLVSFVPLLLTSIVLYVAPEGRVAYWSDWRFLGLSKPQWGDIHINLGFLFLAAGCLHLVYNWKPVAVYLKNKARELKVFTPAFTAAFIVNLVFLVGTLLDVPPFSAILDFGSTFKEAAAVKYGEPPYGHAELSSLRLLARRTDLDLETATARLAAAGIQFTSDNQTILEIAQANATTPKAIYDLMALQSGQRKPFPKEPFPGMGRMVLEDLCRQYGLDTARIVQALAARGIKADPAKTLKEIAQAHASDPHVLFEIIGEAAGQP